MAASASQILFHPLVTHFVKFGSITTSRDKIYRAAQFFCRLMAWYLSRGNKKISANRWNALKSHLATSRKLLRLGKPVEHLQAALRLSLATGPTLEQITAIARQIAYCGFLIYDAIVWAHAVKFIKLLPSTSQEVSKISNRFWLAGIVFSIAHGFIKIVRLTNESKKLLMTCDGMEVSQEIARESKLMAVLATRYATRRQILIDLFDVWLPATALEIVSLNEGLVAALGLTSSLIGVQTQWRSVVK